MRKRALPNTAAGDEREKKSLQHEVSQALKEVQEEFLNIAQQAGSACKLVDVDVLLQDVVKSAGGAELQPHEAAADRKLLNAALTRAVGSLHSALSVKPTLAALKTKMRAVADAAPVSADVRCTYAEALADALRDVKPDAPGAGETAALKYLQKKGGGGGGGGEEELEITEGTGDTQARFKCPISQAPMKLPMKKWVPRAKSALPALPRLMTPLSPFSSLFPTQQLHLRPRLRQR